LELVQTQILHVDIFLETPDVPKPEVEEDDEE
jgi:hypothetical protein